MIQLSGLNEKSEEAGFIVAYPSDKDAAAVVDLEPADTLCPFARHVRMIFVKDRESWPDVVQYWRQRLDLKENADRSDRE